MNNNTPSQNCPDCGVPDHPHFWSCPRYDRTKGWRNHQHKIDYSDLLNQPIKVGSYITYAATVGRSSTLRIGKVVELTKKKVEGYRNDYEILKVKVKAVDMGFGDKTVLMSKLISLEYFHRLIVIPDSAVNQHIKDLLDNQITIDKESVSC